MNLIPGVLRKPTKPKNNAERDRLILAVWSFARIILVACVAMTVTVPSITWYVRQQDQTTERREDQKVLDVNYLNCQRGNEVRVGNINDLLEPSMLDFGVFLDGSEPAWFSAFLDRLVAAGAGSDDGPAPGSQTDRRIKDWVEQFRRCGSAAEWQGHTPGIRLNHEPPPLPPLPILERYGIEWLADEPPWAEP